MKQKFLKLEDCIIRISSIIAVHKTEEDSKPCIHIYYGYDSNYFIFDEYETEYWYARELQQILEYKEWRNFNKVLERAKIACENSGFDVESDFVEVNKIVEAGATTKKINDYKLTRYACYLIAQNGDPRKEVIALAQTYFAIQTRKQELRKENIIDKN